MYEKISFRDSFYHFFVEYFQAGSPVLMIRNVPLSVSRTIWPDMPPTMAAQQPVNHMLGSTMVVQMAVTAAVPSATGALLRAMQAVEIWCSL